MSWLIESYLEEGKHGPDHPESLNMRSVGNFRDKQYDEMRNSDIDRRKTDKRFNMKTGNYVKNDGSKADKTKFADTYHAKWAAAEDDVASKYAFKAATSQDDKERDYATKNMLTATRDATKLKNAANAIDRHNRRHPERAVKESVSDIVESLQ